MKKVMSYKCPNCGGDVELKDNITTFYCMYCGKQLHLEDDVITIKTIDQAKIREEERKEKVRMAELEYEYKSKQVSNPEQRHEERMLILRIVGAVFFMLVWYFIMRGIFSL